MTERAIRSLAGLVRDAGDHHRVVLGRGDVEVLAPQFVGVALVDDETLEQIGAAGPPRRRRAARRP